MSPSYFNLSCFGIEDQNIQLTSSYVVHAGHKITDVILARLTTQKPDCCPTCHSPQLIRNGYRMSHIRLANLGGHRRELHLKKQRFLCKHCGHTFGLQTTITAGHDSLSCQLKGRIMDLARLGEPASHIALLLNCSPSTVIRTIDQRIEHHYRVAVLPKHLCFDEFHSVKHTMSFICCDAVSHQLIVKLPNRLSRTIINYFENRYSKAERSLVQSVVVDMNAQYSHFIHRLFPQAAIIIDRFHITQLAGRALDSMRITLAKSLSAHSREYRILKSQWRLFHKDWHQIEAQRLTYLRGINEYTTQQNAIDLVLSKFPEFEATYQAYQLLMTAVRQPRRSLFDQLLAHYQPLHTAMDTVISTLKHYRKYITNSLIYPYSNGPLEGLNRKIKDLKRHCYGFRNLNNFFKRIDCLL